MVDHDEQSQPIGSALFRLVMEELPAVVWATDSDLRFIASLGAGLSALNLQHDQVVGMSLFTFFQTEDREFPAIAAHYRALAGESASYEQDWAGCDYHVRVDPLRGQRGARHRLRRCGSRHD